MTPERGTPKAFQFLKWKGESIPLWEHEERMLGSQLGPHLAGQLAEQTFDAVAPNGDAEAFADDNAYPARSCFDPAYQQVEAGGGEATAMLFDILDVAAGAKKVQPICTVRHGPAR